MKTLRFKMLVLLTVLGTATFAGTGEKKVTRSSRIEVVKNQPEVFKLFYLSEGRNNVTVKILDQNAKLLFSERLNRTEGFARPYNLEGLPLGSYTFIVKDAAGQMEFDVNYEAEIPKEIPAYVRLSDSVNDNNDLFKLTIVSSGDHDAEVAIYDPSGEKISEEVERFENQFSQLYHLQHVSTDVIFEVTIDGIKKRF